MSIIVTKIFINYIKKKILFTSFFINYHIFNQNLAHIHLMLTNTPSIQFALYYT